MKMMMIMKMMMMNLVIQEYQRDELKHKYEYEN